MSSKNQKIYCELPCKYGALNKIILSVDIKHAIIYHQLKCNLEKKVGI